MRANGTRSALLEILCSATPWLTSEAPLLPLALPLDQLFDCASTEFSEFAR